VRGYLVGNAVIKGVGERTTTSIMSIEKFPPPSTSTSAITQGISLMLSMIAVIIFIAF
jgi:hypothetical protein